MFLPCSKAMVLLLDPLSVTLIDRDMPLADICVPAGFPSPAADDLEDTVDPFRWVNPFEQCGDRDAGEFGQAERPYLGGPRTKRA